MDKVLKKHPGIHDAAHDVSGLMKEPPRLLPQSVLGYLMYVGRLIWGAEKSDPFWESIATAEGLKRATPAYTLYRKLLANKGDSTDTRQAIRAYCVKAFNAAMTGNSCKALRYEAKESFPKFARP